MKHLVWLVVLISSYATAQLQNGLTVELIMRDPKWMGSSPGDPFWSEDGKRLYFYWNPVTPTGMGESDSLYYITPENLNPRKLSFPETKGLPSMNGDYNRQYTKKVYEKNGDIFLLDIARGDVHQITQTIEREHNPRFLTDNSLLTWLSGSAVVVHSLNTGSTRHVAFFKQGRKDETAKTDGPEKWLESQQLELFDFLKEKKGKEEREKALAAIKNENRPTGIHTGDKQAEHIQLSPDGRFITYQLVQRPKEKIAQVPNYLTGTGFSEMINTRKKVGFDGGSAEFAIYDLNRDTVLNLDMSELPGLYDLPDYTKDYPAIDSAIKAKKQPRRLNYFGPFWSSDGKNAFLVVTARDNKDRWIIRLLTESGTWKMLDRQRDEAWIGGPGIYGIHSSGNVGWMPDNERVWFHSEKTGFSHLYAVDINTGKMDAITSGNYEVQSASISRDKKWWYLSANMEHPGEVHFYRKPIGGGAMERISSLPGKSEGVPHPSGNWVAIRHSFATRPWEIYLKKMNPKDAEKKVTNSVSPAFSSYSWREPEFIRFKASDGTMVPARLYKPSVPDPNKPAVIFVHGAGYLQNAHKWWSTYFREYMFHNLLADKGYYVLDIDYRGSAGYGRDWRTSIYRHMGGKDLDDHIDGARYLVETQGVDSSRIGIYGGSYGGFITFMALFTSPGTFKAGAALRPVTDWAQYNHGYTSNILNEPAADSIAYARSSPINFAHNLQDRLLVCHGMLDLNVHFQDVVMLSQRLIELGKDNWELAVYPVEDHGFKHASSWTDEYKRILKLFEEELK